MNVLGINGWIERGHDAAACLIIDGEIVAFTEEERFIRKKHSYDVMPIQSIAFCLNRVGLKPDDVDIIAIGWDLPRHYHLRQRKFEYTNESLNDLIFPPKYFCRTKKIPIQFVSHHLAHAASAYFVSGFNASTIVVMDGQGENESVSIWLGENGRLKELTRFPIFTSLGYFYEAACEYLGFSNTHAGKVMGLAGYGRPDGNQTFFEIKGSNLELKSAFKLSLGNCLDEQEQLIQYWINQFQKIWGKSLAPTYTFNPLSCELISQNDAFGRWPDIAATLQSDLERVYLWIISEAIKLTGNHNVVLAGGVSLNCSANGRILDSGVCEKLFIVPTAYDAGVALGAALYYSGNVNKIKGFSVYLGPNFTNDQLKKFLLDIGVKFQEPPDIASAAAQELARGKIAAWFQGRMEIGPRALGARSILSNPCQNYYKDRVNRIKSREMWRPLAPSILGEYSNLYLANPVNSPYMLIRTFIKPEMKDLVPAVIHCDGSVRAQTVYKEQNEIYYRLIQQFYALTDIPLVLNTSFNYAYEPIVCTPFDAIKTFISSGIDVLALGPFLIKKEQVLI